MADERYDLPEEEEQDNRRGIRIILIILAVILLVFGGIYTGYYFYSSYEALKEEESLSQVTVTQPSTTEAQALIDNPIDFKTLWETNADVIGWLQVPDTKVDYPIVQHGYDDSFYLKHSAVDQSWKSSGAIYTELCNFKDFTDRVTVIYGHNGYSDTMFTTLHYFEKADFFNEHEFFYIYRPGEKLTYRIVSAFKYDDRHIMNSFDFHQPSVFAEFEEMIMNPQTTAKNVRELEQPLGANDKIVVLSTCITNQKSNRYLVCGVLMKNEKTN